MDWSADLGPSPAADRSPDCTSGCCCFRPTGRWKTRVFEGLVAAGFADLTPAQARVFARIAPGGSRLTDLAAQGGDHQAERGFPG